MGYVMSTVTQDQQPQSKLQAYLSLARISNSPTVVTNVVVGAALAGSLVLDYRLLLLCLSLVAFYTAGMFLNDICDYEIDRQERANRPLVTGALSMREAWAGTLVLFALAFALLAPLGWRVTVAGVILTGLIVLYDTWHKKNIVSPLVMGANRFMVYVVAYLAYQPTLNTGVLIPASMLLLYILGVTFVAKSETSSERFTKYWPVAVLILPALYYVVRAGAAPLALVVALVFVGWVIYSTTFIYQEAKRNIGVAVSFLLAGISLLDATALAALGSTVGLLVGVAGFGLTLFLQQYIRGT